jgi:hypothetical protein
MLKIAAVTRRTAPRATQRVIHLDDEPLMAADLKAIAEADAAYARGDYCSLDEAKAYVARLRSN